MTENQTILALLIRHLGLTENDWKVSFGVSYSVEKPKKSDLDKVINECANEIKL